MPVAQAKGIESRGTRRGAQTGVGATTGIDDALQLCDQHAGVLRAVMMSGGLHHGPGLRAAAATVGALQAASDTCCSQLLSLTGSLADDEVSDTVPAPVAVSWICDTDR